jgi:hypothetical protein
MPNKADLRVINDNPITGSICENCEHLIKRIILPFDEEEFGINREELDIPDDEDIFYEHFFCKKLVMDLDHIVISCNKYIKESDDRCLFINKKLL